MLVDLLVALIFAVLYFGPFRSGGLELFALILAAGFGGGLVGRPGTA